MDAAKLDRIMRVVQTELNAFGATHNAKAHLESEGCRLSLPESEMNVRHHFENGINYLSFSWINNTLLPKSGPAHKQVFDQKLIDGSSADDDIRDWLRDWFNRTPP